MNEQARWDTREIPKNRPGKIEHKLHLGNRLFKWKPRKKMLKNPIQDQSHLLVSLCYSASLPPSRVHLVSQHGLRGKRRRRSGNIYGVYHHTGEWRDQVERRHSDATAHCWVLAAHPSVCLSVCPSLCLSICLSVCPSVCLSVHTSVHPSVRLFVHLSICLSIHLFVHPSVCLFFRLREKLMCL